MILLTNENLRYLLGAVLAIFALAALRQLFKKPQVLTESDEASDVDEGDADWTAFNEQAEMEEIYETPQEEPVEETNTNMLTQDSKNPYLFNNKTGDPKKVAILMGTNKCDPSVYQGDSLTLKGCVNDALSIRKLAAKFGYGRIYFFTDTATTINNFIDTWKEVSASLQDGDTLLVQRSGHGMSLDMNVLDKKGDTEIGGTNEDGTIYSGDQGAVLHDGVIVDDVYWRLLLGLPKVKVIWINDSCHSATQYKLANSMKSGNGYRKPRTVSKDYMPGKDKVLDIIQLDKLVPAPKNTELTCTLVSVAGCQEHEYSQDAYLDRKYQGAMTCALMSLFTKIANPTPEDLKKLLPIALEQRGFTQKPQVNIEGDQTMWSQPLL